MKTNGNEGANRNLYFPLNIGIQVSYIMTLRIRQRNIYIFSPKDLLKILKELWSYIIIPAPVINTGYGYLPVCFIQGEWLYFLKLFFEAFGSAPSLSLMPSSNPVYSWFFLLA